MQIERLSRRRFIGIVGAAAGMALFPGAGAAAGSLHRWNGVALGARASIQLVLPDADEARRIIDLSVSEIERLERIFSLYRAGSAVSRLNRDGRLIAPPHELVELLARAATISAASDGAFDVTVQPLWLRYRDHFMAMPDAVSKPVVDDVLPLVDWRAVDVDAAAIAFGRPGMAITLNGIAQGYITDAVAALMRRNGIEQVALNLGETRTMGRRPDGGKWVIGIADPSDPARLVGRLEESDRAIATSGGYGTVFDHARRYSHLLDPRSGGTASVGRGVTVVAAEAWLADAWSTAFSLMGDDEVFSRSRALDDLVVYVEGTPV